MEASWVTTRKGRRYFSARYKKEMVENYLAFRKAHKDSGTFFKDFMKRYGDNISHATLYNWVRWYFKNVGFDHEEFSQTRSSTGRYKNFDEMIDAYEKWEEENYDMVQKKKAQIDRKPRPEVEVDETVKEAIDTAEVKDDEPKEQKVQPKSEADDKQDTPGKLEDGNKIYNDMKEDLKSSKAALPDTDTGVSPGGVEPDNESEPSIPDGGQGRTTLAILLVLAAIAGVAFFFFLHRKMKKKEEKTPASEKIVEYPPSPAQVEYEAQKQEIIDEDNDVPEHLRHMLPQDGKFLSLEELRSIR